MHAAVQDGELIPGLLDDIWIGVGRGCALQCADGLFVMAQLHFGAAKIVRGIFELGIFLERGLDGLFALFCFASLDLGGAQLKPSDGIVWVKPHFLCKFRFGFFQFVGGEIFLAEFFVQSRLIRGFL